MAHTMEYQELLKRFDTFETRFDKLEARYATKDFVRAEIAEIRTEIKSVENRLLNRVSVGAILIIAAIIGGYFV